MKKLYLFTVFFCLAKFGTAQLTVNTSETSSTICAGNSSTITASVSPVTGDPITYSWSPAAGLNTTTGAVVVATPSVTTTYTVNAVNTVTSETGSNTSTITVDPASFTLAGVAGGSPVCQSITIPAGGTYYRDVNCRLMAGIVPAGANPVTGIINTCVQVDTGANKMGSLDFYVARRYDIEPATDPEISTANITLYYLQSEFDNYNLKSEDSGLYKIPTGPGDATGISNLRLRQFHGTGPGPGFYSGGRQDFKSTTPGVSIVWNASMNWWEITVPVSGFSGFYVSSRKGSFAVLPVTLEYFKGSVSDKKNVLSWKANCSSDQVVFDIERSDNGYDYTSISRITASQARCSMPFEFNDAAPLIGKNYYRLKIIDVDAEYDYSNTVLLSRKIRNFELLGLNPNLVVNDNPTLKVNALRQGEMIVAITDMSGRNAMHQTIGIRQGINSIKLNTFSLAPGAYLLRAYMPGEETQTIQFIKQ